MRSARGACSCSQKKLTPSANADRGLEDLLYDYSHTVETIESFLGLDEQQHVRKMQSMSPEDSIRRSIGHADKHPDQNAISMIKSELNEYCFEVVR